MPNFNRTVEIIERQIDAIGWKIASTTNPIEALELSQKRDELRVRMTEIFKEQREIEIENESRERLRLQERDRERELEIENEKRVRLRFQSLI
jgi:hypothetical protein